MMKLLNRLVEKVYRGWVKRHPLGVSKINTWWMKATHQVCCNFSTDLARYLYARLHAYQRIACGYVCVYTDLNGVEHGASAFGGDGEDALADAYKKDLQQVLDWLEEYVSIDDAETIEEEIRLANQFGKALHWVGDNAPGIWV